MPSLTSGQMYTSNNELSCSGHENHDIEDLVMLFPLYININILKKPIFFFSLHAKHCNAWGTGNKSWNGSHSRLIVTRLRKCVTWTALANKIGEKMTFVCAQSFVDEHSALSPRHHRFLTKWAMNLCLNMNMGTQYGVGVDNFSKTAHIFVLMYWSVENDCKTLSHSGKAVTNLGTDSKEGGSNPPNQSIMHRTVCS